MPTDVLDCVQSGRVGTWVELGLGGDNMTAWRKKQIQNIKLLSVPILL